MCGAGNGLAGWRGHLRICGGFLALSVGFILAMPGIPRPGIPLILFGLVLLSARFVWAKRALEWAKRKWSKVRPVKRWRGTCADNGGGRCGMNTPSTSRAYLIAEEFNKALKLVRHALVERELSITGELDTTESLHRDSGTKQRPSRLLLVDSPILTFEAMALDRAAGALIPMHLLVSADGDRTQVVFVEPATLLARRPPAGAAGPLEELKTRINAALESAVVKTGGHWK